MESGGEVAMKAATEKCPMWKIVMVASIAAGVQFGWALQLSLLTPYVQLLGVAHTWAAYLWLCGPISGMLVQPIVGYHSDRCTSRFGRRRPFIAAGAGFVAVAVVLIGYAADIGYLAGDDMTATSKPRAIVVFAVGFWVLDVANNMLQGPCRAFLADLSGGSQQMMRTANALFSFFMAVGNVLGYAAGSYSHLYKLVPFTRTGACDIYCANLKTCFFISITLLLVLVIAALAYVKEEPWSPARKEADEAGVSSVPCSGQLVEAFKNLKKPMRALLLVTCINWIAWFPFLLFDTDWMGREVYGGDSNGDAGQLRLYDRGVEMGALGLMLQSVVLGFVSLGIEVTGRWMGGTKKLWGLVNFILAICLASTVLITKLAKKQGHDLLPPPIGIRAAALLVFSLLGIPLAITFSIPFALASIFSSTSGAGQGLSLGVLNLSIVFPQMLVSVVSGPLDALFGGGNLPAFVMGAIAAVISGVLAITMLPSPKPEESTPKTPQTVTAFH